MPMAHTAGMAAAGTSHLATPLIIEARPMRRPGGERSGYISLRGGERGAACRWYPQ